MVLDVAHDLPNQVKSEAAGSAFGERRTDIGLGSLGGVEGRAAIGVFESDGTGQQGEADFDGAGEAFAFAMAEAVHEEFFEDEVQVELDIDG